MRLAVVTTGQLPGARGATSMEAFNFGFLGVKRTSPK